MASAYSPHLECIINITHWIISFLDYISSARLHRYLGSKRVYCLENVVLSPFLQASQQSCYPTSTVFSAITSMLVRGQMVFFIKAWQDHGNELLLI